MERAPWPPIEVPELRERLRAPDRSLPGRLAAFIASLPPAWTQISIEDQIARAYRYPWSRPTEPVLVRHHEVLPDGELDDDCPRYPLIAFGSNASPRRLAGKFEDLAVEDLRIVPGDLHDHDICAMPAPSAYGSMAAGIAASPGTIVRVALLHVTAGQFERLTLSEFTYAVGRLDGIDLRTDDGARFEHAYAFRQRLGLYAIDDEPVALAAIPARRRSFRALTQHELLDDVAMRVLGGGARAEDLLRAMLADPAAFLERHYPDFLRRALRPPLPGWTPHPLDAPDPRPRP